MKAGALKGETLTFVSYGGIYQDGQAKAAINPFATESGAKILQDGPTDNAKIKAQVQAGNVTWDVIDTTNMSVHELRRVLVPGGQAVLVGRPPIWGLAVDGERGAARVLELLRAEIATTLALLGCTRPAEVSRAHVQPAVAYDRPA